MYSKSPAIRAGSFVLLFAIIALFLAEGFSFGYIGIYKITYSIREKLAWSITSVALGAPLWVLALWAYLMCALSDPGFVEDEWKQQIVSSETPVQDITRRGWTPGEVQYCLKCAAPRPERAHHCGVCKRCVRRMDHHCPWTANCIGFGNYRYFMQFALYTGLASTVIFLVQLPAFIVTFGDSELDYPSHLGVGLYITFLLCFMMLLAFALAGFALFATHVYWLMCNLTAIEANYSGSNPYDFGKRKNWEQLYGRCGVAWFIPVALPQPLCDGYTYPSSYNDVESSSSSSARCVQPTVSSPMARMGSGT